MFLDLGIRNNALGRELAMKVCFFTGVSCWKQRVV